MTGVKIIGGISRLNLKKMKVSEWLTKFLKNVHVSFWKLKLKPFSENCI